MKVFLTGGRGFIGQHLQRALVKKGHEVLSGGRRQGIDFNAMLHAADWLPHLQKVDVVINTVGIIAETAGQDFSRLHHHAPAALFQACVEAGVQRVIQISALGADDDAFTPYQLTKKAADDVLRSLPLTGFVLRPSLVYGEGGDSTRLFCMMSGLPLLPVIAQGQQRIQPVHIDDLVETVLTCMVCDASGMTLDVVGPEAMTFREWLQRLRRLRGKSTTATVSMPYRLAILLSSMMRFIAPMMSADNLRMLQRGNTSDVTPLAEFLGKMPRAVP